MKVLSVKRVLLLVVLFCSGVAMAGERGFAIFIDKTSYEKAKEEVNAYAQSVEKQGLKTYIIEDVWYNPDSIRAKIKELATQKNAPIEGMVFIGDIPVPMLLDAQHFASGFKPKQSMKRLERSSCPSDRFYDDLDLEFEFIAQDDKKTNLFYYTLTSQSTQVCAPELYSGRIKPCDKGDKTKYDRLKAYLNKVVVQKEKNEILSQIFYFGGHGYNSESMLARMDEKISYYEHFPWLKSQNNGIVYMDHLDDEFSKFPLMSQMQRKDLSLAVLHHHGYPDEEYLNGYPLPKNAADELKSANRFFRSKIRKAVEGGEDKDAARARWAKKYDIPLHWLDSIFTRTSILEDSLYNDKLDLHLTDLGKYQPNAKVVILDACFNGAFNHESYIAGEYIFEGGDCVITIANSVNSLQDKWCDRHIGMLGYGLRVGNLVKYNPYLGAHIFGDPTFTFVPGENIKFDANEAIYKSAKFWKKQLKSASPAVKAFALEMLVKKNAISSSEMLEVFKTSSDNTVRLVAYMMLTTMKDDNFVEATALALNDSYELVQRFGAVYAGKSGDERLIPALVSAMSRIANGSRVDFQLRGAIEMFPHEKLIVEFEKQDPCKNYYDSEKEEKRIKASFDRYNNTKLEEELDLPNATIKEKINMVRNFRNKNLHTATDKLMQMFMAETDEDLRYTILEAFGWFNYSYKRAEIINFCEQVWANEAFSDKLRNEAQKTAKRLKGI
ncbi:MAG: hypothetical protein IJ341_00650 [Bacteroidales bacterium]|nr:hypothetical protein [Bacteroidales bacterium]